MTKKTLLLIHAAITAAIVLLVAVPVISSEVKKRPKLSDLPDASGDIKRGNAPDTRTIQFDGKTRTLVYQKSINNEPVSLKSRSDTYGAYDVYTDEAGGENITTEYEFLYNS
ncbi:MAG: hypothetical protein FWD16_01770, partial [Clostridia bacterium]|nr:hypothetical protein [Clostridia bacterium]